MSTLKERYPNEDKMIIYQIKNLINGKSYVGQSTNCFKRRYDGGKWWVKGRNTNKHLLNSVKKYRLENFELIILEKSIESRGKLDELEKFHIKNLNCIYPNGYNYEEGGQLHKGEKHILLRNKIAKNHSGGKVHRLLNNKTGVIHEFINIQKFADDNNLSGPMLSIILSKKINSHGNLYYKQHREWTLPEFRIRKILFISPDGENYLVLDGVDGGIKGFCKKQGFKSTSNVFALINGTGKTVYGWKVEIIK